VDVMCDLLRVSRSGYYAWRPRPASAQAQRRAELTERIAAVHGRSRQVYGSPRVHAELAAQGVRCTRNTVAKLMRQAGLRSKMRRRFVVRTTDSRHGHPLAENLLDRQFTWALPNQAWVADITCIPTAEGWLYLAAVLDLCSRKVVGWAAADHLRAELACDALQAALDQRGQRGELLHHSDRGVQYACDQYQQLCQRHGLRQSMSRPGNCYDNAVMESFFGTLKTELVHHENYPTRESARQSLFEYLEVFYNRQRSHSSLDYLSPQAHEAATLPTTQNISKPWGKSPVPTTRSQAPRPRKTREGSYESPTSTANQIQSRGTP
jgi:putative transposase